MHGNIAIVVLRCVSALLYLSQEADVFQPAYELFFLPGRQHRSDYLLEVCRPTEMGAINSYLSFHAGVFNEPASSSVNLQRFIGVGCGRGKDLFNKQIKTVERQTFVFVSLFIKQ